MIRPLDTLTAVLLATRLRARDVLEVTCMEDDDDVVAWAAANARRPGMHWALIGADNQPVAMGGARWLWPGVAETWLAASEDLPRYAAELLRAVRRLHEHLAGHGIRRFQTMCQASYATGHRFLARLGYVVEGRARGWGKRGEDYDFMARIEGDAR